MWVLSYLGTGPTFKVLKAEAPPPEEATGVKAHPPQEVTGHTGVLMAEHARGRTTAA